MTVFDFSPAGVDAAERFSPLRAAFKLWYLRVLQDNQYQPSPRDLPSFATGINPRRVLLLGNGPTHGWGVFSHRHALTGQLATALADMRGETIRVDYVGEEMMNAQTALHWLGDLDLQQYDQIVVVIGWNDAVRLTPDNIWQPAITDVLDTIHKRKRATATMLITGIEHIKGGYGYSGFSGNVAQARADKMNAYLETYALKQRDTYLQLSPRPINSNHFSGTADNYRIWANEIATIASPLLSAKRASVNVAAQSETKFNWVGTKRALGLEPGTKPSPLLIALEAEAADYFNVELAQVSILDGERQWMPNHLGPLPASVPRHLSYCDVAGKQTDLLLVPNSKKDTRFNTNPYLDQAGLPFYAGQALFSRDGEVIGTFCLLAAIPRPKWSFRRKKFKQFAARAQQELWRIEDLVRSQSPEFNI